jgi:hypothetical protein
MSDSLISLPYLNLQDVCSSYQKEFMIPSGRSTRHTLHHPPNNKSKEKQKGDEKCVIIIMPLLCFFSVPPFSYFRYRTFLLTSLK